MTGAAEGVEGVYDNAAAPAVREPFSLRWFDLDVAASISFPGAYGGTDFDNRQQKSRPEVSETTDDFLYYNLGAQVQLGEFGGTIMSDFLTYDVTSPVPNSPTVRLTLGRIHAVGAYGLLGNQVVVGAGARVAYVNIDETSQTGAIVSMLGAAPEAGVLVKPDDMPFRVGTTVRAAVTASALGTGLSVVDPATNARVAGGLVLPARITQPWEVELGGAYQLGPRPLNPRWIDPDDHERGLYEAIRRQREGRAAMRREEIAAMPDATSEDRMQRIMREDRLVREDKMAQAIENVELDRARRSLYLERKARYLNWPRERVLLLASILVTGPSEQAVALEGFIDQRREIVGKNVSVAPRFAVETEAVPNLLRLRTGVYSEPSRFDDGTRRQHFTFGADVRLFSWDVFGILADTTWRISAVLDVAPRYQNIGVGIGAWH